MKILVTGGHLTPALAAIDYIQANHTHDLVFVGRRYSQDKTRQTSQEQNEIAKRHIHFVPFYAPRLSRHQPFLQQLLLPVTLFIAIVKGIHVLQKEKPDVVVTFGGYLAVPIAIAAWLLHIPVITHEQTHSAGFANQCIALVATKVAISYPESNRFFPQHKTVVTGNPIRKEILDSPTHSPEWIQSPLTKPLLLITCGNQGSHTINMVVAEILDYLTQKWTVVHLTGNPTAEFNDETLLTQALETLPTAQQKRYYLRPWVSGTELAWLYTHATGALARSGANTVQELATRHIPSVFIPLPFAHRNEQVTNAQYLVDREAGILLEQANLNAHTLQTQLELLHTQHSQIRDNLTKLSFPTDADKKLFDVIVTVAHET